MDESVPRTPSIAKSPVTVQKVSLQKLLKQKLQPDITRNEESPTKPAARGG
jgi:hypothetical protein